MALSGLVAGFSLLLRVNFGLYAVAVVVFDLVFVRMLSGKADSEPYYATPLRSLLLFAGALVLSNVLFYGPVYGTDSKIVFAQSVTAVNGLMRKFGFLTFRPPGLIAIALPVGGLALKMLADEEFSSAFLFPLPPVFIAVVVPVEFSDCAGNPGAGDRIRSCFCINSCAALGTRKCAFWLSTPVSCITISAAPISFIWRRCGLAPPCWSPSSFCRHPPSPRESRSQQRERRSSRCSQPRRSCF